MCLVNTTPFFVEKLNVMKSASRNSGGVGGKGYGKFADIFSAFSDKVIWTSILQEVIKFHKL